MHSHLCALSEIRKLQISKQMRTFPVAHRIKTITKIVRGDNLTSSFDVFAASYDHSTAVVVDEDWSVPYQIVRRIDVDWNTTYIVQSHSVLMCARHNVAYTRTLFDEVYDTACLYRHILCISSQRISN